VEDTDFIIEPNLLKLRYGGWMAVSGSTTSLRIGVIGRDEGEARSLFSESLTRWKEIHEGQER
jgi:hypothetical protein